MRKEIIGDCTLYLGVLLGMVYLPVFCASHQYQILNSIICFVAILMVDYFINTKRATKIFFHNHAMQSAPDIRAMVYGCKRYIALGIMRHSGTQKPFTALADIFPLKASATFGYPLSQRPFRDRFIVSAFTAAKPIMQAFTLGIITDNSQATKAEPSQIRNAICSPILCIGG